MKVKTYAFKDLLSNIVDNRGKTCPVSDDGLPLIATNCIKADTLYPVFEKVRYVSDETYRNWFRGHPEPGDIIFVCKGSPGRVAWTPDPVNFCIAQDMLAIRVNEKLVESKFLFALLRQKRTLTMIENMHVGTMIPHFKKGDFDSLFLNVPEDRGVQKYIGETYFQLSEKIELNRQMNQTLEAMAQALFKSWFVDFDPVIDNAIAADHEIPEPLKMRAAKRRVLTQSPPVSGGDSAGQDAHRHPELVSGSDQTSTISGKPLLQSNPALAALFPSQFEYNETLGKWIPEGWEVKTINDVATVVGGGTPSTKIEEYYSDNGLPWLSPKDLSGYDWKYISKGAKDITELGLKKSSAKMLPAGTVVFSSRAPIGYLAIAENDLCTNQGFKSLVPDQGVPSEYLFQFLKANTDLIDSVASGSTFKEVSGSAIKGLDILTPNKELLDSFSSTLEAGNRRSLINQKEYQTLTQLRDTLLPQLISDKVRVIK